MVGVEISMNNRRAFLVFLHESQGTLSDGWQREENSLEITRLVFCGVSFYTQAVREKGPPTFPRRMPHRAGVGSGEGKGGGGATGTAS